MVLLVAPTGVGKTQVALDLLEWEYLNHFDYIVILCPTIRHEKNMQKLKVVLD